MGVLQGIISTQTTLITMTASLDQCIIVCVRHLTGMHVKTVRASKNVLACYAKQYLTATPAGHAMIPPILLRH